MSDVTQILQAIEQGDDNAATELLAIVYDELHRIASRKLAGESPGQTLQTTALVHEAYLRLLPSVDDDRADDDRADDDRASQESGDTRATSTAETSKQPSWQSRGHFFGAAAEAMRRILIDNARKKGRLKRGGDRARVDFDDANLVGPDSPVDLLALDEALIQLEEHDQEKAVIVKLRFFAGLTLAETAEALDISTPTVQRHWRFARAWLRRAMEDA